MNKLVLVESKPFGSLTCDIYQGGSETDFFMTRNQIGEALEYDNPQRALSDLHRNNSDRLDAFSVVRKIRSTDGKLYDTTLYSNKGIMEICRYSRQPNADDFMDFTWEVMDGLMKGKYGLVSNSSIPQSYPEALRAYADAVEQKEAAEMRSEQQAQIIGELKPKADYTDTILQNKGLVTITQIAKDYGMSGQAMNTLLHDLGVQYNQSGQWLLYSMYHGHGYTHSATIDIVRSNGMSDVKMNTKWTQKGRLFIYNLLKENGHYPLIEQNQINKVPS